MYTFANTILLVSDMYVMSSRIYCLTNICPISSFNYPSNFPTTFSKYIYSCRICILIYVFNSHILFTIMYLLQNSDILFLYHLLQLLILAIKIMLFVFDETRVIYFNKILHIMNIKSNNSIKLISLLSIFYLIILGACYICYNHFLQDGCKQTEGCVNEAATVDTVVNGVSKSAQIHNHHYKTS